jgi:hypothetical protein
VCVHVYSPSILYDLLARGLSMKHNVLAEKIKVHEYQQFAKMNMGGERTQEVAI